MVRVRKISQLGKKKIPVVVATETPGDGPTSREKKLVLIATKINMSCGRQFGSHATFFPSNSRLKSPLINVECERDTPRLLQMQIQVYPSLTEKLTTNITW